MNDEELLSACRNIAPDFRFFSEKRPDGSVLHGANCTLNGQPLELCETVPQHLLHLVERNKYELLLTCLQNLQEMRRGVR